MKENIKEIIDRHIEEFHFQVFGNVGEYLVNNIEGFFTDGYRYLFSEEELREYDKSPFPLVEMSKVADAWFMETYGHIEIPFPDFSKELKKQTNEDHEDNGPHKNIVSALFSIDCSISMRELLKDVLLEARRSHGLSERQICRRSGVSHAAVKLYINSKASISVDTYEKLLNMVLEAK